MKKKILRLEATVAIIKMELDIKSQIQDHAFPSNEYNLSLCIRFYTQHLTNAASQILTTRTTRKDAWGLEPRTV